MKLVEGRRPEAGRQPGGPAQPIAVMAGQLTQGGSERQLYFFLSRCDRARWAPVVYVSGALGVWESPVRALGIPVVKLHGNPLAKMRQFRSAVIAQGATCFFSWSSYTNGFGLALVGLPCRRVGSFRNALFADLPARRRWLWSWMSLAGIDVVVCNSRETEAQMTARTGGRKTVVYVPNALQIFPAEQILSWRREWRTKLGIDDQTVLIVGVGRLAPQKRFDRFVEVIAQVSREWPVSAVIAGEDMGGRAALEAQIRQSGLEGSVRLIGSVPDARHLMCAADIFLLTSDHEGTPNVVMEAMAARVPCVTTPVGGVNKLIEDEAAGFITTFATDDLVQAVARLAADRELRKATGARALAAIEDKHRVEDVAGRLWALCERGT